MAFIFQAVGSLVRGESQAVGYEYRAAIARQNAVIAQQQGVAAVEAQQRMAARRIGSMVANYGASGVQTDAGSPLDVLADSAAMATLDKLTLEYNYKLRAMGFEQQAATDLMGAKAARTSGYINAGTAIAGQFSFGGPSGGGSSAPSSWGTGSDPFSGF